MEFAVLGRFQVCSRDVADRLRRTKPKVAFALLLANANRPVSTGRFMTQLWGDRPPRSAVANLYTYVCAIRRILPVDGTEQRLICDAAGYTLAVADGELDALRHWELATRARAELRRGDPMRSAGLFAQAVRLWRGRPLADLPANGELEQWVEYLEEQHRAVLRDWTDARLQLGLADELVGELRGAVAADPLCERVHAQLMLALYRAGRVAEALDAFATARQMLVDELGLDPGPSLRRIQAAMLRHDPSLVGSDPGAWLAIQSAASRP
ncbi:MAG: AfsR/SARP family transcriptional regulator [Micromonosporaceae bacterium]|nr:AfsR/SARP family transcriptional regulator [Micromonosporaceae bacterium]